jgi:hypothetical protein
MIICREYKMRRISSLNNIKSMILRLNMPGVSPRLLDRSYLAVQEEDRDPRFDVKTKIQGTRLPGTVLGGLDPSILCIWLMRTSMNFPTLKIFTSNSRFQKSSKQYFCKNNA